MNTNHPEARLALITGSGRRRVGSVVARHLAQKGYSIALHYHSSEEAARAAVKEIRGVGVDCEACRANVAVESDVETMIDSDMMMQTTCERDVKSGCRAIQSGWTVKTRERRRELADRKFSQLIEAIQNAAVRQDCTIAGSAK